MSSKTKQEEKKKEKIQAQGESQLTYDPNNPEPHDRRRQFAVPDEIRRKRNRVPKESVKNGV